MTSNQIAHDLAVAAAGVMMKNFLEKHPKHDCNDDAEMRRLYVQMVDAYKRTYKELETICRDQE